MLDSDQQTVALARSQAIEGSGAPGDHRRTSPVAVVLEWGLVACSPLLAYYLWRLALMAAVGLPDPSIHSSYVVDPHQFFARYEQALAATARMREGARVGFVVPARISYELFGAVPGFVVLRYLLALVGVVPSYLLLKRLYGRPAGALAAVLVLSCPVFVRAWGTDYPNAAAVFYLLGAIACLGLALVARRRLAFVAISGALLTAAVWSFATSLVLGAIAVALYLLVQGLRSRKVPWADALGLLAAAIAVTGLLAVGSYFLLGQLNYIGPTWHSYVYLSTPSQEVLWHSRNWHWVVYDTYLLVLPAVAVLGVVTFARRFRQWRQIPLVPGFLIAVTICQLAVAAYLQFFGGVQILEVHFWSSLLWASAYLLLAVSLAEIGKALWSDALSRWLPAIVMAVVPLLYEAHGSLPAMKWDPTGLALLAVLVVAALLGRAAIAMASRQRLRAAVASLAGIVAVAVLGGGLLALTVAPPVAHPPIPKTVSDPPPDYAAALGVSATFYVDQYRVVTRLPGFAGEPSYRGEQLFIWWPISQFGQMIEPMGIFHAGYNSIPGPWGTLAPEAVAKLDQRKPGQVLLMSTTGFGFGSCLRALAPFGAHLVRRGVLASGPVKLHVWLIDLDRFIGAHRRAS